MAGKRQDSSEWLREKGRDRRALCGGLAEVVSDYVLSGQLQRVPQHPTPGLFDPPALPLQSQIEPKHRPE